MKKKYIEPQMIVEDFTVSEMVAADCVIPEAELKVVSQMSHNGCDDGTEPKYWVNGEVWGKRNGKGDVYANFSDIYNDYDLNPNNGLDPAFTRVYANKSPGSGVCSFVPSEHGVTFGFGMTCNDDVSALQKS